MTNWIQTKDSSAKLPAKFVREMEQIIDHGLDSQTEEWQKVMKNLKLSQEGFFRKLKNKYPSLTPNDLRLCSYLRMNFTTKEIANLTNISSQGGGDRPVQVKEQAQSEPRCQPDGIPDTRGRG